MTVHPEPPIPILFEDNHLLVVEKPPNLPTQADISADPDLLTLLKEDIKQRYQKPGNVYLGLVHRLDRPVGGVMVLAKTSKAASRLSDQVRTRSLSKTYLAVVHGYPQPERDTLIHFLWKNEKNNTVFVVDSSHPNAKEAKLDYVLEDTAQKLSLVRIHLHTGRPHQIRVQMAAIGCPLYGDQKYGKHVNRPGQQIALWAVELAFDHPVTKERLSFVSSPPKAFPWTLWSR